MDKLLYYGTGGFLKGYRTYLLSGLGVATAVVSWAVGDTNTHDAFNTVWQIVLSTSVATVRKASQDQHEVTKENQAVISAQVASIAQPVVAPQGLVNFPGGGQVGFGSRP